MSTGNGEREPSAEDLIGLAGLDAANRQFERALAEQVYKLFARVAALEERLREVEETLAELEAGK